MKTALRLIFTACLLTSSLTSYANFSGPYGSAAFGYEIGDAKDIQQTTIFLPSIFNIKFMPTQHATDHAYVGALALGYSDLIRNKFIVGLEGRFTVENLSMTFSNASLEANSALNYTLSTPVRLRNDWGLLLKLGALLNEGTMLYGLIGPEWGYFNVSSSTTYFQNLGSVFTASTQAQKNFYDLGLLLGIGIERKIVNHMSIAFEYTHSNYATLNFPRTISSLASIDGIVTPGTSFSNSNKITMKTNNAFLKLNYYL